MAELDSKARAAAVYAQIDTELRDRKRHWIWASVAAVLLASGFVLYHWAISPSGPAVRQPGTVVGLMQVADDTGHDVRLVVTLDGGRSIRLVAFGLVPIGSRVFVGERKNRFGGSRYEFLGLASDATGK